MYSEIMEELCAEEGQSLVAETMAPLHDQLVELQRAKDVAAMQVCHHEQCILVSLGLLVPTSTTSGFVPDLETKPPLCTSADEKQKQTTRSVKSFPLCSGRSTVFVAITFYS